jgi:hypothetical protein
MLRPYATPCVLSQCFMVRLSRAILTGSPFGANTTQFLGISDYDCWTGFGINPVNHSCNLPLLPIFLPERYQVHVLRIDGNKTAFLGLSLFLFGHL